MDLAADGRGAPDGAVAIIGVSCRLPGGIGGLPELWTALEEERDMITTVPADRFDTARFVDISGPRTGKSYTAAGGFLDDIAGFDAAYFGIAPKEAAAMDPQHRLLLELTAEALDDAAVDPARLAGTDTAVFVGVSDGSYALMPAPREITPYTMVGGALSLAANRVSHAFDLRGPSMSVDTACSSALVALDRACRALRDGSCRTALCGGVNVLLNPQQFLGFSQASMLSARGRCAAFSADADGFVRAEGGVMVLLKPLADARADGDRVHGVILGTGTNCDGRTPGVFLPSAEAQEDLLRRVCAETGVDPDELVYFEAHGTGTPVGDPIEATAIGRALGMRRITGDLPVGSVKANLGHLEPAAGMAGLCKALLVLRHRAVPAAPHAEPLNPAIDFTGLGLRPVTARVPVAASGRAVVGVNSFGFGGANAHLLVAAPDPAPEPDPPSPGRPLPVLVSARSARALGRAATRLADRLDTCAEREFPDVAGTLWRRGRHEHRAVVLAAGAREAARGLRALAADGPAPDGPGGAVGRAAGGRVAFVYAGNGSQWPGMGSGPYAREAAFRDAVDELDAHLAPCLGWSVAEVLTRPPDSWRLEATEYAQPLLLAVQSGITAVLRAHGITPSAVPGHSVGEVAAAHAAGVLDTERAARVIAERSAVQAPTRGRGRMAAVGLSAEEAADVLARYGDTVVLAGINSPRDVTVAGPADGLAALGEHLRARGVFFQELDLDHAFHSPAMDDCEAPLARALAGLAPSPAAVPFYSTVTGTQLRGTELDAHYWWHNIRRPVRFADAAALAREDGADVFLELGPHPVLGGYLRRSTGGDRRAPAVVLPTLRRDEDGPRALSTAVAALIAAGAGAAGPAFRPGRVVDLPAYPWEHRRHWTGGPRAWLRTSGDGTLDHPLLGERMPAPHPQWHGPVEPVLVPWLRDHRLQGAVLMPATGYVEMALAAGRRTLDDGPLEAGHLLIRGGLVVPWDDPGEVGLQTSLRPDDGTVTIASTARPGDPPRVHATARVRVLTAPRPAPVDPAAVRARCPEHVATDDYYRDRAATGLEYGPAFQVLTGLSTGPAEVLAAYRHEAPGAPFVVHPAVLDGALQAGVQLLADRLDAGQVFLPASIAAVRVWDTPSATGFVWVREHCRTEEEVRWDLTLTDPDGNVTVRAEGCRLRRTAATGGTPVTVHHTVVRAAPPARRAPHRLAPARAAADPRRPPPAGTTAPPRPRTPCPGRHGRVRRPAPRQRPRPPPARRPGAVRRGRPARPRRAERTPGLGPARPRPGTPARHRRGPRRRPPPADRRGPRHRRGRPPLPGRRPGLRHRPRPGRHGGPVLDGHPGRPARGPGGHRRPGARGAARGPPPVPAAPRPVRPDRRTLAARPAVARPRHRRRDDRPRAAPGPAARPRPLPPHRRAAGRPRRAARPAGGPGPRRPRRARRARRDGGPAGRRSRPRVRRRRRRPAGRPPRPGRRPPPGGRPPGARRAPGHLPRARHRAARPPVRAGRRPRPRAPPAPGRRRLAGGAAARRVHRCRPHRHRRVHGPAGRRAPRRAPDRAPAVAAARRAPGRGVPPPGR
ncbi:type I polyketide synthase [Streptomyces mobaraensis]|uniref:type I polyketide synthase n=1 Tax=Streptomyces mobaraensis TaxID=35621 RepID=UPI001CCB5A0E|nr:type I polyketide synthase [Streptomyces mobaraensis]UBI35339.1 type I polyketide synthase [Streptomyces mobaraensis]